MFGHHALLFAILGVVVVGGLLALTLKKKKVTVDTITAEDMQRIDDRLVTGDFARSQSRFRRRYGVEASPKSFTTPPPDKPKDDPKP